MRELTDHKTNPANEALTITVLDEPGPGNANHLYDIRGFDTTTNPSDPFMKRHGAPAKRVASKERWRYERDTRRAGGLLQGRRRQGLSRDVGRQHVRNPAALQVDHQCAGPARARLLPRYVQARRPNSTEGE